MTKSNSRGCPLGAKVRILCFAASLLCLASCRESAAEAGLRHMTAGKSFAQEKNWRSAALSFRVAAQNLPRDPEPQYQLALAYLASGSGAKAIDALQNALRLNPKHSDAMRQLAILEAASGDASIVKQGREVLLAVVKKTPSDGEALSALAMAEAKSGNADEARKYLGESLKLRPDTLRVASYIVSHYAAKGSLDEAAAVARDVRKLLPESAEAAFLAAQVAAAAKNPAESERQLQQALTLKPNLAPALELLLRKRVAEHDTSGAEQIAQRLARLPEREWRTVYGKLLFAELKVEQGMAEFERLLASDPENAELGNEYAALLAASGRKKEAATLVDKLLKRSPNDKSALLQRAALALDRSDAASAATDLTRLKKEGSRSAAISFQQARLHGIKGETVEMGQALTEALQIDPGMLPARLEMAKLLTTAGRPQTALTTLDAAGVRQKQLPELQFHRIAALIALGDWKGANEAIQAAKRSHSLPGFYYQEAVVLWQKKDSAGAERALRAALSKAPADTAVLRMLGEVLRQQGQQAAYVSALQSAASLTPGSGDLQMMLGEEWTRQGERKPAREAYSLAERLGAGEPAIGALALLDMAEGSWASARDRLEKQLAKADSKRVRILLGSLEGRPGGNPDRAIEHYTAVLQQDPTDFPATNNLADLFARTGKLDQAQVWANNALRLSAEHPAAQDTAGWISYLRGDYRAALPYLERSLQLQDRPVAHYHLAAALAKSGQLDRGRREFETAVKMAPGAPEREKLSALFGR